MHSINSGEFVLSKDVKPLSRLLPYREKCLSAVKHAPGNEKRELCPVCEEKSSSLASNGNLPYRRCLTCTTLFLENMPSLEAWSSLISKISTELYASHDPDDQITKQRREHVYAPKASWIADAQRIFAAPTGITVALEPVRPEFNDAYAEVANGRNIHWISEAALIQAFGAFRETGVMTSPAAMAEKLNLPSIPTSVVLLESLDRSHHPKRLIEALAALIPSGGFLFITALLSSGFEMRVLQGASLYLFPPDKAHCLSFNAMTSLLASMQFETLESSTPGVLDCDSVLRHLEAGVSVALSSFEETVLSSNEEARRSFQNFLQLSGLSSFGRFVARRR